jgi:two-component system, NarL family, invasion response regulator UvrY
MSTGGSRRSSSTWGRRPAASHTLAAYQLPVSTPAAVKELPMMEATLPVLVVDDQAPFRSAAKAVVRRMPGFDVVGEATSGEEAVDLVAAMRPALVLMDINMPGINGVEATRRIVAANPGVVVILCSTYPPEDLPPDASSSGALAYVNKEELGPTELERIWAERETIQFLAL